MPYKNSKSPQAQRSKKKAFSKWYLTKGKSHYRKRRLEWKLEVFRHYGGNPPICACCGEQAIEFLTIDHINGNGHKHRREVNTNFYWWLISQGFPQGYQVLCMNCNFALGRFGYCPHKATRPQQ